MIRSLLLASLVCLSNGTAWAGNEKATIPSVHLDVSAPLNFPAAPSFNVPGALNIPNAGALSAAALPQAPVLPHAAAIEAIPQAQLATPEAQNAAAQGPIAPVDPKNAASVHVAAELTDLRNEFSAQVPDKLSDTNVDPLPGHEYHASPEDWRDELFYSIMLDRYAKGPDAKPVGDPKKGDTRHGGDLKGLTSRLDYIKASGATTILLSPVAKSLPEAYHNYAPVHFMQIDPHFGTMEDMKTMVAEAHKRGLRVVLDIVLNHAGPVFEYEGGPAGSGWKPVDQPRKDIGYWTEDLKPAELKDPERFTRRGVINDWNDHDQSVLGDFPPNYRHFRTDEQKTQDMLIHIAKWWIKETDIDGFRLDAIKHVDPNFVRRLRLQVTEYAASLGKNKFFILGENSSGVDEELAETYKLGVDSVYAYPEYRRNNYALHGKAPAKALESSVLRSLAALGSRVGRTMRFIDLHDTYRFLRAGEDMRVLKVGLAFLMFSIGIPLLYYGTEQGFRQTTDRLDPEDGQHPADPENRADMFDSFDAGSEPFLWTQKLAELRQKHVALRRGEQWVRWADEDGAGLYAFSRIHDGREAVVALNTAGFKRAEKLWIDAALHRPGDVFIDELDPTFETVAVAQEGGGLKIYVDVPPNGTRLLVRKA